MSKCLASAVECGDLDAITLVGQNYLQANRPDRAVTWFTKAATGGHIGGMISMIEYLVLLSLTSWDEWVEKLMDGPKIGRNHLYSLMTRYIREKQYHVVISVCTLCHLKEPTNKRWERLLLQAKKLSVSEQAAVPPVGTGCRQLGETLLARTGSGYDSGSADDVDPPPISGSITSPTSIALMDAGHK